MKELSQRMSLWFSKPALRRAVSVSSPVVLMLACSGLMLAAGAAPISGFASGVKDEVVAAASAIAIIGIVLAGFMYLFGSGRMAEIVQQVGIGCFLLGGAADLAAFFFGTS